MPQDWYQSGAGPPAGVPMWSLLPVIMAFSVPPEDAFQITVNPKEAPGESEVISIHFEKGVPVWVNGIHFDPVTLVSELNKIGGRNGIGRMDLIENRVDRK